MVLFVVIFEIIAISTDLSNRVITWEVYITEYPNEDEILLFCENVHEKQYTQDYEMIGGFILSKD